MIDLITVVPALDPIADRKAAQTLSIATGAMWLCVAGLVVVAVAERSGAAAGGGVGVALLASLWTLLAVNASKKSRDSQPELVARLHEHEVEMGAPLTFRLTKGVAFSLVAPVNVVVTRQRSGVQKTTKWVVRNGAVSLMFVTLGHAAVASERVVADGLASVGLTVSSWEAKGSVPTDG